MTPPHRFVFFVNPAAGSGHTLRNFDRLRRRHGADLRGAMVVIADLDQVRRELGTLPSGAIPVCVGGDGTLNVLVRALRSEGRHRDLPLGLLPLGTGNALAHSFSLGRLSTAIATLLRGESRPTDALITTHAAAPLALASISLGFEARLMTAASRFRTWHRLAAVLAEAARALPAATKGVRIDLDERPWIGAAESFFVAGLYNLRCYAFGRLMFPTASLDDGQAEASRYASSLTYLRSLTRDHDGATRSGAASFADDLCTWRTARVASPGPIQLDGESVPGGDFEIRVESGAYRLVR